MSLMLTLHIAFLLVWSGALLYFPQLLVQQADASETSDAQSREQALKMQHGLYAFVMTPAGLLAIVFGSWMLFERGFAGGWLPAKLCLVLLMVFFHVYCGNLMEQLKEQGKIHSRWFYRALLLPPILLIPAVITLVVQKPF